VKRPKHDPVRLGSGIGRVLDDLGHGRVARSLEIARIWEETVGTELARHSEPAGLSGGVLMVSVPSSSWAQHFQMRKGEILAALTAALGDEAPADVRFRVG